MTVYCRIAPRRCRPMHARPMWLGGGAVKSLPFSPQGLMPPAHDCLRNDCDAAWNSWNRQRGDVSAGVAAMRDGDSVEDVLTQADKALYQAKQAGRNCTIVADKYN